MKQKALKMARLSNQLEQNERNMKGKYFDSDDYCIRHPQISINFEKGESIELD